MTCKTKIVIVSGYFNPVHKGHLEYFTLAKKAVFQSNTGNSITKLYVIVNNDYQRQLKNSREFQDQEERTIIISNLRMVDQAILSIDQDRTVCQTLAMIAKEYQNDPNVSLAFANGGDQNNDTIPERKICQEMGIELIDGLGDKIQSSSWLLGKTNTDNKQS